MLKYRAVHRALVERSGFEFVDPPPATWDELALVHTPDYLRKARTSRFSTAEIARLELPLVGDPERVAPPHDRRHRRGGAAGG